MLTPFHNRKIHSIRLLKYETGCPCLRLFVAFNDDGFPVIEPHMTASVNMPFHPCEADEVYIKNYNENSGIQEWLIANNIIEPQPVSKPVPTGWVEVSRFKLTKQFLASQQRENEHAK